jgi:CBS domain-containing protein
MTRRICDVMHDNEDVMHDNEEVVILPPSATVHAAAAAMAARHQCAVLVMTAERLQGIFTEQDIVRRVVAERRDPDKVTLAEVMTPRPDTIPATDEALRAGATHEAIKVLK